MSEYSSPAGTEIPQSSGVSDAAVTDVPEIDIPAGDNGYDYDAYGEGAESRYDTYANAYVDTVVIGMGAGYGGTGGDVGPAAYDGGTTGVEAVSASAETRPEPIDVSAGVPAEPAAAEVNEQPAQSEQTTGVAGQEVIYDDLGDDFDDVAREPAVSPALVPEASGQTAVGGEVGKSEYYNARHAAPVDDSAAPAAREPVAEQDPIAFKPANDALRPEPTPYEASDNTPATETPPEPRLREAVEGDQQVPYSVPADVQPQAWPTSEFVPELASEPVVPVPTPVAETREPEEVVEPKPVVIPLVEPEPGPIPVEAGLPPIAPVEPARPTITEAVEAPEDIGDLQIGAPADASRSQVQPVEDTRAVEVEYGKMVDGVWVPADELQDQPDGSPTVPRPTPNPWGYDTLPTAPTDVPTPVDEAPIPTPVPAPIPPVVEPAAAEAAEPSQAQPAEYQPTHAAPDEASWTVPPESAEIPLRLDNDTPPINDTEPPAHEAAPPREAPPTSQAPPSASKAAAAATQAAAYQKPVATLQRIPLDPPRFWKRALVEIPKMMLGLGATPVSLVRNAFSTDVRELPGGMYRVTIRGKQIDVKSLSPGMAKMQAMLLYNFK